MILLILIETVNSEVLWESVDWISNKKVRKKKENIFLDLWFYSECEKEKQMSQVILKKYFKQWLRFKWTFELSKSKLSCLYICHKKKWNSFLNFFFFDTACWLSFSPQLEGIAEDKYLFVVIFWKEGGEVRLIVLSHSIENDRLVHSLYFSDYSSLLCSFSLRIFIAELKKKVIYCILSYRSHFISENTVNGSGCEAFWKSPVLMKRVLFPTELDRSRFILSLGLKCLRSSLLVLKILVDRNIDNKWKVMTLLLSRFRGFARIYKYLAL